MAKKIKTARTYYTLEPAVTFGTIKALRRLTSPNIVSARPASSVCGVGSDFAQRLEMSLDHHVFKRRNAAYRLEDPFYICDEGTAMC